MTNRLDSSSESPALRALEKARADLARSAQGGGGQPIEESPADPAHIAVSVNQLQQQAEEQALAGALAARLDLLRARLTTAREDPISALLFCGDAGQDCAALAEICDQAGWRLTGSGVALLSDSLRRLVPAEPRHLDLVGLLIDALYALRRTETRSDMGKAGEDLLRGLRLAVGRELGRGNA